MLPDNTICNRNWYLAEVMSKKTLRGDKNIFTPPPLSQILIRFHRQNFVIALCFELILPNSYGRGQNINGKQWRTHTIIKRGGGGSPPPCISPRISATLKCIFKFFWLIFFSFCFHFMYFFDGKGGGTRPYHPMYGTDEYWVTPNWAHNVWSL